MNLQNYFKQRKEQLRLLQESRKQEEPKPQKKSKPKTKRKKVEDNE